MRPHKLEKFSELADEPFAIRKWKSGLIGTGKPLGHQLWRQNFTLLSPDVADGLTILS